MEKYTNFVIDEYGNKVTGVTVRVLDKDANTATIYSNQSLTAKSNPFTNDSDGGFSFYAQNGRYSVELTGPVSKDIDDICLFDVNDRITQYAFLETQAANATTTPVVLFSLPTQAGVSYAVEYFLKFTNAYITERLRINHSPFGDAATANGFFQTQYNQGVTGTSASSAYNVAENVYSSFTPVSDGSTVTAMGKGTYNVGVDGDFGLAFGLAAAGGGNTLYVEQGSWLRLTQLGVIASVE